MCTPAAASKVNEGRIVLPRLPVAVRKRRVKLVAKGVSFKEISAIEVDRHLNYKAEMTNTRVAVDKSRKKAQKARSDGSTPESGPAKRFIGQQKCT